MQPPQQQAPRIDLTNEALWVPVYRHLLYVTKRRRLIYGSRDSAKSYAAAQLIVVAMMDGSKYCKVLLLRKVYDQIKDSQYQTIKDVVRDWGLNDYFIFRESPLQIICKLTGWRALAKGLDKSGKAKSIKDPSVAWIEEVDELTELDYQQTTLSLRGPVKVQEVLTFNPPVENHWLVKRFFVTPRSSWERHDGSHTVVPSSDPDTHILHTTFWMNPYCTPDRVKEFMVMRAKMPSYYLSQGLGLIAKEVKGTRWIDTFSRIEHHRAVAFNPALPVHLSFDQNNLPYATCLMFQVQPMDRDGVVYVDLLREYCIMPPHNSTEDICQRFTLNYGQHRPEVYIYGDPTGGNDNQRKRRAEAKNHYAAIETDLAPFLHRRSKRVLRKAPPVIGRRRVLDTILTGSTYIRLRVHPTCVNMTDDFEYLLEDGNGGFLKPVVKDEHTKQQWEERGHCMDALIYFLHQAFTKTYTKLSCRK